MAGAKGRGDVLPVIGWYWRDWRASTARASMSPLARGLYRELLDAHYGERDCALLDDDKTLAALAGVDLETWMRVREEIVKWLPLNKHGRRQNPRAFASWKEARAFRKSKQAAGKRGSDVRWKKDGTAIAEPMANDSPPPPIPSPPNPHPSEGSQKGIPSVGSPGPGTGGDGTAAERLLSAEPNARRQKPGPNGATRTLESGRSYLARLYPDGVAPDTGRRWLDETRNPTPSPGALLRFTDPAAFADLAADVAAKLPSTHNPEAYIRTALAARWAVVLGRLREERARAVKVQA